jgi:signal transduction histidine kinase/ActR/RegA family two-component response regulator
MKYNNKSKEELILEIKELSECDNAKLKQTESDLLIANKQLIYQNNENEKLASELIIANNKLKFQNKEKEKRVAELIIANNELDYQNTEKEKRAAEFIIVEESETNLKTIKEEYETINEENSLINEELIRTNCDLNKAKEHAEESDRLKTAFLQNMSHEIRTPMNAIMGFSDLLIDQYNNKPKLEKYAAIIGQRCNDLLDIINDILDIAKIESGQLPINMDDCNLNELFSELSVFFKEHQKRIGKQHINFNLQAQCNPSENMIITDKGKLKQIFINLIGNAFKFTENGRIDGGCKYNLNHELIFYVTDSGIGIPLDKQDVVFERFAQLHQGASKNIGGTGLGLSIVKGLVDLLGGKIQIESESGKGTTFSLSIPYKISLPLKSEFLIIKEINDHSFTNKTILIVEDDYYSAEYLKETLADTNMNVLYAINGKEAIEISLNQSVDIVLMDIRLPDFDGYEATRQIKKLKPNLKIIAQTAFASHDERQKALIAGCNEYVSKPTKKELLFSIIHKLLSENQ